MKNIFTVHQKAVSMDTRINKNTALKKCLWESTLKDEWIDFLNACNLIEDNNDIIEPCDIESVAEDFADSYGVRCISISPQVKVIDDKFVIDVQYQFAW